MTIILGILTLVFFKDIDDLFLRWLIVFIYIYIFFWLNDFIFNGSSIGKKIMKMNIVIKSNSLFFFATIHALLKIFFSFIWVISLVVCLVGKGKMPYDNFLYKKLE